MSSVAPTSPRPPNMRAHSNSHTPSSLTPNNNNGNGNGNSESMQVDAVPSSQPPSIAIPISVKQSTRNGITTVEYDRDDLNHSTSNSKQDSQHQIQTYSARAHIAERRLALLENTLSLPLTYPSALPSPMEEKPDVSAVLKDASTGEMDTKLRQAALAVKECEIRTDKAQALVVQRERELSRARQEIERLQAELNSVLGGRDRDELSRAKEDATRMRDEAARTREVVERTRDELHSAQNEIARLSSSTSSSSIKTERYVLQAWDEADSFLRLCEGRMAEARSLFSRILTNNREGSGWLPPLPPPHQASHHYQSGPPSRDTQRIASPLMTRTTPIVPSNAHAPIQPPPPPTMAYPRPPNQHPQHPRHRRDRSLGPDAYNAYEDDVREGERPNKRHRAASNAGYYPEESFRSPPGASASHRIAPPPPTNTVRQYNTYPDVAPSSHAPPSHHPSAHQSSQHPRHRSRSSSGSTSIDEMLLAASEPKPQNPPYHEYKPRERGDSGASTGGSGGGGHYPVQPQQTQTHVFAPVQTGAPVKKGKTNPSLDAISTAAPQQFYPATNEAGQRLCRQCGMTGRYKDNKCVEKWGPGPLGPGTVCDRCRKKMKRVERRGTLEGQQQQAQAALLSGGGGGNQVVYQPIGRSDTVIYPPPPPHHPQGPSSASSLPQSSPVKDSPLSGHPGHHHPHSNQQQRNSNPVPHPHPGPPPPHTHQPHAHAHPTHSPHPTQSQRRTSPPPPIEVLPQAVHTPMEINEHRERGDRERDRGGERDRGDVDGVDEVDEDADADGDGEDIEGELLDAVEAAEKSQGGAD